MFASGISISYVAMNALFARVEAIAKSGFVTLEARYALSPMKRN